MRYPFHLEMSIPHIWIFYDVSPTLPHSQCWGHLIQETVWSGIVATTFFRGKTEPHTGKDWRTQRHDVSSEGPYPNPYPNHSTNPNPSTNLTLTLTLRRKVRGGACVFYTSLYKIITWQNRSQSDGYKQNRVFNCM